MILVMPWIILFLSIVLPLLLNKFMKNKSRVNLIVDLFMFVLCIFLFITAIFKWMLIPSNPIFLLGLDYSVWIKFHDLTGMILSGLVTAHVILHWKWIKVMLFKKKK